MAETIQIWLNGETKTLRSGITIEDLLVELELSTRRIAVAVNGEVAARSSRGNRILSNGDVVELIQAVAGG